jgi:hypothetical protein
LQCWDETQDIVHTRQALYYWASPWYKNRKRLSSFSSFCHQFYTKYF